MKAKLLTRSLRYRIYTCSWPLVSREKAAQRLKLTAFYSFIDKTLILGHDYFNGNRAVATAHYISHGE